MAVALLAAVVINANADVPIAPPRCGTLQIIEADGPVANVCPLDHTDVNVDISGFIARVTLTQRFHNPTNAPIEAVYVFPMSDRAAVDSMDMRIGDRVVKGVIKEKGEARAIYNAARNAGQVASLLDQERPNIFTQSVANIMPQDEVIITISYVEYLKYEAGEYEYSFPMVVGPRYNPAGLGDAHRISPPVTPKNTRAGHDISLTVNLDAGVPLQALNSELHSVNMDRTGQSTAIVELKNQKSIPNRDFVLSYAVAGKSVGDAVLTHAGDKGKFFSLILQPPDRVNPDYVTPKEMIFVIDKSGSMGGFPIEKAKKTMRLCIEGMNPDDTFNLVSFAGGTGYCFEESKPNTQANRHKALEYLSNLQGGGGTEMMKAIDAALGGQRDPERLRVVCFMTDGFIGNDMAIIDRVQKNVNNARVFAFGIGNSVNRFLIENMARVGRGASEIVTLETDGDEAVDRFHSRIQSPLLTDIKIDFGGLEVADVYPQPNAIPDLFSARPLIIKGRYTGGGKGVITLRGRTAEGPYKKTIDVTLPKRNEMHDVLAPLWARTRIAAIMDEDWLGIQQGKPSIDTKGAITNLGLQFGLMTQFTSFVAVEDRVVNQGGHQTTVQVPIEMADGVSYEGIFGDVDSDFAVGAIPPPPAPPHPVTQSVAPLGRLSKQSARRTNAPLVEAESIVLDAPREMAEDAAPADELKEKRELDDALANGKLDPALKGLAAKVKNGRYTSGDVKVTGGVIEIFVYIDGMTEKQLESLRAMGGKTLNIARSSGMVHLRIGVENLEALATLEFVTKITPPIL
jgi:Ca-activated chloride channel family protein